MALAADDESEKAGLDGVKSSIAVTDAKPGCDARVRASSRSAAMAVLPRRVNENTERPLLDGGNNARALPPVKKTGVRRRERGCRSHHCSGKAQWYCTKVTRDNIAYEEMSKADESVVSVGSTAINS
ncbi:hypothetical protein HPB47_018478 [Ixodes persulcatus]|uniref:Uncharacterized protein n=1 Tax=Ixodes persulcatus TaxID=34615 RepID=A0AC60QLG2_IXOPE|nr:hypothetical protein HPB47_018478 [Ixodes persulcatus]